MIKILADSSADYPVDMKVSCLVTTLPLMINFGGETYRYKVDLTEMIFMKRLRPYQLYQRLLKSQRMIIKRL